MSSILAIAGTGGNVSLSPNPIVLTAWIRAEVGRKISHHCLLSYQGLLILPWREEDDKKKLTIIR